MKKLIICFATLLTVLFLIGCDKPAPTELNDDTQEDQAEYEILGKDYNDEYYSNGFDTTGVTQDVNNFSNLISVTGIKETDAGGSTLEYSFAQAIFFDRSQPVYDANGRLLGYNTVTPGEVKFDNLTARIVPFNIRFRENGELRTVTLGNKYLLFSGRRGNGDQFHYRHNSSVQFRLNFIGGQVANFNIQTPIEITGTVNILGSRQQENLRASLSWNKGNTDKITIIIGARLRNRLTIVPLFRVRTRDDGNLIVPARYINSIPVDLFDRLVFIFVRRFEKTNMHQNNSLQVSSQSIHSIVKVLP